MQTDQRCLIALGGNVGITSDVFAQACEALSGPAVVVESLSSAYRTAPVGNSAGAEFLNAAAVLRTTLSAPRLLQTMHTVEQQFGRQRVTHWGPRTLDLDLLLHGTTVIDTPELVIPHPAMWYRRFVLAPAAEIAADMWHPLLQQTVGQLWQRLQRRPLVFQLQSATVHDTDLTWLRQLAEDVLSASPVASQVQLLVSPMTAPPTTAPPMPQMPVLATLSVVRWPAVVAAESASGMAVKRSQPHPSRGFVLEIAASDQAATRQTIVDILQSAAG